MTVDVSDLIQPNVIAQQVQEFDISSGFDDGTAGNSVYLTKQYFTNKMEVTNNQLTLYDDDDVTPVATQTHADDGTTETREKAT